MGLKNATTSPQSSKKDVFCAFYHRALAKRLLLGRSVSDDAEKAMLQKLKDDYDPEFGMGDHMFRDLALSCDTMVEYHACLVPERAIEQKLTTNGPTTEFLAVLFRANMRN
ncbi:hypothetical protein BGW80DRAFT_1456867 [Lactifluus volemus]|nr:hypothetical protein BGW80DRAFT_1456867 [Lactifluus volemus]